MSSETEYHLFGPSNDAPYATSMFAHRGTEILVIFFAVLIFAFAWYFIKWEQQIRRETEILKWAFRIGMAFLTLLVVSIIAYVHHVRRRGGASSTSLTPSLPSEEDLGPAGVESKLKPGETRTYRVASSRRSSFSSSGGGEAPKITDEGSRLGKPRVTLATAFSMMDRGFHLAALAMGVANLLATIRGQAVGALDLGNVFGL